MKSQLPALMIPKGYLARPDGDSGVDGNTTVSADRAAPDGTAAEGVSVPSMLITSACFEPRLYRVAPRIRSKKKRFG